MKNETGRSMVEMLGVLAIIGVLSVAGIAGYTMAMKKYKANEILNIASQCAVIARTYQGVGITESTDTDCFAANGLIGAAADIPDGATAMKANRSGNTVTMKITSADYADILASTSGGTNNSNVVSITYFNN